MAYTSLSIEEDSRKFREFMKTQLFRNASRTLTRLETDAGGLTPAEIWNEVTGLINDLKTIDAYDRDIMVSEFYTNTKRRVREIERDGMRVFRPNEEVERTVTCIFYCLALCLEATTKDQENNPHNNLLDALVEEMIRIDHPILSDLYNGIKTDGDKYEARAGEELIEEKDPLEEDDEWTPKLAIVFKHYADRMWKYVDASHKVVFNKIWDVLLTDVSVSEVMRRAEPLAGDEHLELGIDYNAKCIFNIYGILFRRGFFIASIKGETPLARIVSEHYHCKTGNKIKAKYEYFKSEMSGIKNQFKGMTPDVERHVIGIIENIK